MNNKTEAKKPQKETTHTHHEKQKAMSAQATASLGISILAFATVAIAGSVQFVKLALGSATPFLEAAAAATVFAVITALVGTSVVDFALTMPATGIKFLNLSDQWDDFIVVRWAAMLFRMHELHRGAASVIDIQSVLFLVLLTFIGMRVVHHAVVVLRVLKVARRNSLMILKASTKQ